VFIAPDRPGFDWAPIEHLDELAAVGLFGGPVCAVDLPAGPLCGGTAINRQLGRDIEVDTIVAGRRSDPDRPDEVVATEAAAQRFGLTVGTTFTVRTPTPEQLERAFATGEFPTTLDGPPSLVRVVGVRAPSLSDRLLLDVGSDEAVDFTLTPAFAELRPGAFVVNGEARLASGTDVAQLRQRIGEVVGDDAVPVRDLAGDRYRFERGLLIERSALLAFAAVAVLAGAVLVSQALARLVQSAAEGVDVLSGLGATRTGTIGVVAAPFVVTLATAAATAIGVAALASTRFPSGTARALEPDHGVHLDPLVAGLGLALLALAVGARVLLAARAAVRTRRAPVEPPSSTARRAGHGSRPRCRCRWSSAPAWPSDAGATTAARGCRRSSASSSG
jgi:hypothetical protein